MTDTAKRRSLIDRLQFSGWLQYILSFLLSVGGGVAALIAASLGWNTGVWAFVLIALAFLLLGLFEVVVIRQQWLTLPDRTPKPVVGDGFAVMAARRACRSFQPRALTDTHQADLKKALRRETALDCADALSQGVVRAEHVTQPLRVWAAVNPQEFLVVIGPRDYSRAAIIEAGRAMQSVVLDLTARGIATCWIGPGADQSSVVATLGDRFDPAQDHVICVIALGYASRYKPLLISLMSRATHRRKALIDLVFEDAPGLPAPLSRQPYKSLRPLFEACRWAPSSYNSQTTRLVLSAREGKLTRARFCTEEGSRYYAPLALGIWAANWQSGAKAMGLRGRLALRDAPAPLAGGLVHDLDWKPI